MNKNNYIQAGMSVQGATSGRAPEAKLAERVPEIPNAIEFLQKEAALLAEEVAMLYGRLDQVLTPPAPIKCEEETCNAPEIHGLLKPLYGLRDSIASSSSGLRDLRSRLMI